MNKTTTMKKLIILNYVLLLLLFTSCSDEYVEVELPPLLLINTEEAAKLRSIVAASPYDEPYKELKAYADEVLDDKPNPLEEVIFEGHVSNHPDRLNSAKHLKDMEKIYALMWTYLVSGDDVYSTIVLEFVEAWAKTYKPTGNDVNDNKMLTCMVAYYMLEKQMSPSQKETIGKWIKTIGDVQKKGWRDGKLGNRAGKRLKLIYFAAYLDNDQERIEWVESKIKVLWNSTLFENGETKDFQRRDALSYHFSTVEACLQIAHIGRLIGKDHYNEVGEESGGSIEKNIAFALPYIKGEKIHPEWVNTKTQLDKDRWYKAGDPHYKPGKPWEPWEAYVSLLLASAFDNQLATTAEKLRQEKNESLTWLSVLAATLE